MTLEEAVKIYRECPNGSDTGWDASCYPDCLLSQTMEDIILLPEWTYCDLLYELIQSLEQREIR